MNILGGNNLLMLTLCIVISCSLSDSQAYPPPPVVPNPNRECTGDHTTDNSALAAATRGCANNSLAAAYDLSVDDSKEDKKKIASSASSNRKRSKSRSKKHDGKFFHVTPLCS